jgi:predicted glycosyltransferase
VPDADLAAWRARAPRRAIVERARPDFRALLARAALSVSQAGYNTVLDLLASGTPAVLVPFADGGQTEQTLRARRLHDLGLGIQVDPARLAAEPLSAAADRALAMPRPAIRFDTDGARRSAELLSRLLAGAPVG